MREIEITLGGRSFTLAANFKTSMEIAKRVGDPLTIRREAALEAMFISRGIPYEPKWRFTVENVVEILAIGLIGAGNKITREEVGELVFETGLSTAMETASDYLTIIFGPQPEEVNEKSDGGEGN